MKRKPHISHRTSQSALPLSGIRVLDLSRILAGPFCTMKLGDMGAVVIKIEQPGIGDETRRWGPPFIRGESAYYLSINRNKKSVTLDLKSQEGKAILRKLIRSCDILVENFRVGVMKKLGFSYADVKNINPRIVYCSISGYGQTSSRSRTPSYDLIIQGESGLMDLTGFLNNTPAKVGISLADLNAGNLAVEAILLALLQRIKTKKGKHIDISIFDAMLSLFTFQAQIALSTSQKVGRKGNQHPTLTPYETYRTKDGFINIAVTNEGQWKNLCRAIGRPALTNNKRFETNALRINNRKALERILIPIIHKKRSSAWIAVFLKEDIPAGMINSLHDALRLPLVHERSMIATTPHSTIGRLRITANALLSASYPKTQYSPPPLLGEHTHEVLASLKYSEKQINAFKKKNII